MAFGLPLKTEEDKGVEEAPQEQRKQPGRLQGRLWGRLVTLLSELGSLLSQ